MRCEGFLDIALWAVKPGFMAFDCSPECGDPRHLANGRAAPRPHPAPCFLLLTGLAFPFPFLADPRRKGP